MNIKLFGYDNLLAEEEVILPLLRLIEGSEQFSDSTVTYCEGMVTANDPKNFGNEKFVIMFEIYCDDEDKVGFELATQWISSLESLKGETVFINCIVTHSSFQLEFPV